MAWEGSRPRDPFLTKPTTHQAQALDKFMTQTRSRRARTRALPGDHEACRGARRFDLFPPQQILFICHRSFVICHSPA